MKKIILLLLIIPLISFSQKKEKKNKKPEFNIEMFDSSEKIVPLRKTSTTIGKCCQVGKALSKLSGGRTDVFLTQSELNQDGTYTIFFVSETICASISPLVIIGKFFRIASIILGLFFFIAEETTTIVTSFKFCLL